ncbi:MAG: hypothetical protein AAGC85_23120, partial [Bacteroidota bacterium]
MIKQGDYVRVKTSVKLNNGEVMSDWVGRVTYIPPDEGICDVGLDAKSLDSLSEDYLRYCVEEGEIGTAHTFS